MTGAAWGLEVVRGREAGRSYRIESVSTVLGNALAGASGIDLAAQETDSPRKMAARQAVIDLEPVAQKIVLRDLDSPGGTFVNRQRLLPGQGRSLAAGDVIQIGAVQLRVTRNGDTPAPVQQAPAPSSAIHFALVDGTICRSWDDFLKVSSQKWMLLRDEITSGRIDAWLNTIGQSSLHSNPGSPDVRLDEWLGKLPVSTPARPELEVHPQTLVVKVTPGGGITTRTVSVSNVGHRLLKINARVESNGSAWLRVPATGEQTVIDSADLPVEITIPDTLSRPLNATLVIDGNGGVKRVNVRLEVKTAAEPTTTVGSVQTSSAGQIWLASVPIPLRMVALSVVAVFARIVVGVASRFVLADVGAITGESPALLGPAIVFLALGALLGGFLTFRRGGGSQVVYGVISGALTGSALSAFLVAGARGVEPLLGGFGQSVVGSTLVWGVLGAGIAAVSSRVAPFAANHEEG